MTHPKPLDPELLITTLAKHGLLYVLIGAMGARLHGFPRLTAVADITPARDTNNLKNLAAALVELKARVFTESIPEGLGFDISSEMLMRAPIWRRATEAGRLDIVFNPAGTGDYEDLVSGSIRFSVFGIEIAAASLVQILRSKEAADRPEDRQDALMIREMLRRTKGCPDHPTPPTLR